MTAEGPVAFVLGPRVHGLALAPSAHWPADPPNLYLMQGESGWVMVDSGWGRPEDESAIDRWLEAAAPSGQPGLLFVSHAHHDHLGGAARLASRYGLRPVALAPERETAKRHSLWAGFATVTAEERVDLGGAHLRILATPGHTPGSMCVHLTGAGPDADDAGVLFTGDTVVGRHSAWVGPPDGDLDVYLGTLARLADPATPWAAARLAPGHGPAGGPAGEMAETLRLRRLGRDADILARLSAAPASARDLVGSLYGQGAGPIVGPGGVAERTIAAHLVHLARLGRVAPLADAAADDPAGVLVVYRLAR